VICIRRSGSLDQKSGYQRLTPHVAAAVFESVFEMCWRRVCIAVQPELIIS
jgi:hypothetical protein